MHNIEYGKLYLKRLSSLCQRCPEMDEMIFSWYSIGMSSWIVDRVWKYIRQHFCCSFNMLCCFVLEWLAAPLSSCIFVLLIIRISSLSCYNTTSQDFVSNIAWLFLQLIFAAFLGLFVWRYRNKTMVSKRKNTSSCGGHTHYFGVRYKGKFL